MTLMSFSERRRRFRDLIEGTSLRSPAPVFDATSARLAQEAGFEAAILPGSIASAVVLGAPDIVLLTLGELVEQVRRITRGSDLPLLVDADHGYGNAVNVARTVQELEAAGAAALTIEDTLLPRRYGGPTGELISRDEFRDKLRAAVAARTDPALVVVGRTGGLTAGFDEALARTRIAAEAGADLVFTPGAVSVDQLKQLREASGLPLAINTIPPEGRDGLAEAGVCLYLLGQSPYYVMLRALHVAYVHLAGGGDPSALADVSLPRDLQAKALRETEYSMLASEYLGT
jgi:carboxyvinyl-carboxyphosphonate phosphorylmutase